MKVGEDCHKVSLFADDLLVLVSNPRVASPSLLEEFRRFHSVSNFKVNMSKSVMLNVTIPYREQESFQAAFPFTWSSEFITYLGVKIPVALAKLYALNHLPLLHTVLGPLKSWSGQRHSWIGRLVLVKMDVLARLVPFQSFTSLHP